MKLKIMLAIYLIGSTLLYLAAVFARGKVNPYDVVSLATAVRDADEDNNAHSFPETEEKLRVTIRALRKRLRDIYPPKDGGSDIWDTDDRVKASEVHLHR